MKELNLEILQNDKSIPFFLFGYKFYLIIQKIKAKFLVGENKYVWVLQNYMNT